MPEHCASGPQVPPDRLPRWADGGRAVTARRSDGPANCRNNRGWRSIRLLAARMTMPRHTGPAMTCRRVLHRHPGAGLKAPMEHCRQVSMPCPTEPERRRFLQAQARAIGRSRQARSGSSMRAAFTEGRACLVCGPVIRGLDHVERHMALIIRPTAPDYRHAADVAIHSFPRPFPRCHRRYPSQHIASSSAAILPSGLPAGRKTGASCEATGELSTRPMPFGDLASASWQ